MRRDNPWMIPIVVAIVSIIWQKEENLNKAIGAYEAALEIYTIEKYPVNYAMTQNNLEIAYGILAENKNRSWWNDHLSD